MILRTLVSGVSLVVVVFALLLQFWMPEIAQYLLLPLLLWIVVAFFLYRLPVMARPIGGSPTPGGRFGGATTIGAFDAGPPEGRANLGFCTYCAAPVEPSTTTCPACGRAVAFF